MSVSGSVVNSSSQLRSPIGIAQDLINSGIYIADQKNHRIQFFSTVRRMESPLLVQQA